MEAKKIDKHVYYDMYLRHVLKNKRVLTESIHKSKAEKAIEKTLFDQSKNKASRGRKHAGRMCILRRFLCKYMEAKKIHKHVYHDMYLRHVFKKKRVLMESIHKSKAEKAIEKTLSDQSKNKASRGRKHA
ncbi:hypothetical protein C5167_020937 [Papaver somniferum]|uniref:Large ribosomal subunit protein eL19 domain-containing protein n=1 Tax=Papaver somniferum TaxID=3469 RepID=A0A4Y7IXL7_PAPSO|nr:hypothetical protein C5167_020937 [Papaver somniferum]